VDKEERDVMGGNEIGAETKRTGYSTQKRDKIKAIFCTKLRLRVVYVVCKSGRFEGKGGTDRDIEVCVYDDVWECGIVLGEERGP